MFSPCPIPTKANRIAPMSQSTDQMHEYEDPLPVLAFFIGELCSISPCLFNFDNIFGLN